MYSYEGYIQKQYCKCCMQEKLTFLLPWQLIKFSSLDLIHMVVRGLLKEHYCKAFVKIRGVIDKFVSFFHRIIIYGWIYIIFRQYQQQPVVNRKKTLKCKVQQTCDVSRTLMKSHVGDVVVKTLEDRCSRCTLSGYICYSTSAIILKFSDNICT